MADTVLNKYLGLGTAAARPVTPAPAPGTAALYAASDTNQLTYWNGAAWVAVAGTTPTGTGFTHITTGAQDAAAYTGTQVTAALDVVTSTTKGLVPPTGGGTLNFLRADGTFALPPGGGISSLTGDVTTPTGSGAVASTIAAGAVTVSKMANLAAGTILGNNTANPAAPIALTAAQFTAMGNVFTSTLAGLVPSSGGGAANFLRADGVFAIPPGSSVTGLAAYSSRTAIAAIPAPALGNVAFLNENGREGIFQVIAYVAATITNDPQQSNYFQSSADATKMYARISTGVNLTPTMFGAKNYDPSNVADSTTALQAFFDHCKVEQNAKIFVYDWAGEWYVSNTIFAVYWDGHEPNAERRFICGTLRFAPLASMPGGVKVATSIEIAGAKQSWTGTLGIHMANATSQYGTAYAARSYENGVRLRYFAGSHIHDIRVDDANDNCVWMSSDENGGFTSNGVTVPTANCIGARVGTVVGRNWGSSSVNGAPGAALLTISTVVNGGSPSNAPYQPETFDPVSGPYGNSLLQRAKVTVNSTADLRNYDKIWMRTELTPAIYGTIAADNATRTFTWTAGDPTAWMNVGDIYPYFQAGPNAGVLYHVTAFSGTSNRVVTVDVAPTTHAATNDPTYQQFSVNSWHTVTSVVDATNVMVFPWVSTRINSKGYVVRGAVYKTTGGDSSNIVVDMVYGLVGGICTQIDALFSGTFSTILAESCEVGIQIGHAVIQNNVIGYNVGHGHLEACHADIMNYSGGSATGSLNIQSSLTLPKILMDGPKGGLSQALPNSVPFNNVTLLQNGSIYKSYTGGNNFDYLPYWAGQYGINNAPARRLTPIYADSATIPVTFDLDSARLFSRNNIARAIWTGAGGAAPTGSLTFNMDQLLINQGWTFIGAGSGTSFVMASSGANCVIEFHYMSSINKVVVVRLAGANAAGAVSGATFTVGGNQVVGARGAAVANGVNSVAVPTQAEFNALVTQFNLLLTRLSSASGHGLIT